MDGRCVEWVSDAWCQGGVISGASSVALPAIAMGRRTDRHSTRLAAAVSTVHSAAAANSARLCDVVTSACQTRSAAFTDASSQPTSQWYITLFSVDK